MTRRSQLRRALAALVLLMGLVALQTAAASPFGRRTQSPKDTSPVAWPTALGPTGVGAGVEGGAKAGAADADEASAFVAPPPMPGVLLEESNGNHAAAAAIDPADAVAKFEAAVRRLLPPVPATKESSSTNPLRSLLAATTTTKRPNLAAATDVTVLPYAYVVVTLTPRRNGTAGVCPSGGARGAEGQKLASVLMRSFRLDPTYASATLAPLQCWVKPGVWDQVLDRGSAPWQAYWVFEAVNWPSSVALGNELLHGDHTFYMLPNDKLSFPRNSSCYTGKISKDGSDGMYPLDNGKIPLPLRSWCSVQNRAGRQALGLHLAYVTHATKGVASCEDGIWNGAESGKDCGAPCKNSKCNVGEGCSDSKDCPAGIACDSAQFYPPDFDDKDGTVALGGLGTCAMDCGTFTAGGGCAAGTIADARYASMFCAADFDKRIPCTGKTYASDGGGVKSCCATTAPCASITTCNALTQYPNPDLDVRCSSITCAGDNAKCCVNKAPCSSAFSSATCTSLDANSIYNSAGYCATSTCSTTTDKATCCPPRALCSSAFTPAVCQTNDPNAGADTGLVYTVKTARCTGTTCSVSGAGPDWGLCCAAVASCSAGFFGTGKTCPAGYGRVTTGSPNCAGRTCTSSDFATCCFQFQSRTCQVWANAQPTTNPVCTSGDGSTSYGGLIASPGSTNCVSNLQCLLLCCTSVGTVQTCDTLRQTTPTFCGASAAAFLSPPLYPSCSLSVSGSCDEACCKKT